MAQNSVVGHMSKRWYTRMNGGPMTASAGRPDWGPTTVGAGLRSRDCRRLVYEL